MSGSRASRGPPFFCPGNQLFNIADWSKSAPNQAHMEERARQNSHAKHPISIEETHSLRAKCCLELSVVRWLFLFVLMQKIAPSALEFIPIYGQPRGWN